MSEITHTPTPWELDKAHTGALTAIGRKDWSGGAIAQVYTGTEQRRNGRRVAWADSPEGQANAAFIVRACNCHEELVEAFGNLLAQAENLLLHSDCSADDRKGREAVQNAARAAIAKATE